MNDVILYASWLPGGSGKIGEVEHPLEIHVHVDQIIKEHVPNGVFRIISILEPYASLKNSMINYFKNYNNCYNHIFTYHQDVLDSFENSTLAVTPSTWVNDYVHTIKEFNVSTVVGGKHLSEELSGLEGYNIRWELFTRRNEIKIDNKIYLSNNSRIPGINYDDHLVLNNSKAPMFDSQFHIAIENTNRISNAFTEKIIDCFQSRTIPIYYGPKNIGDFFNMDGIFFANDASEIIEICNNLNENTYASLNEAIEENYNLSMDYVSFSETTLANIKKALVIN